MLSIIAIFTAVPVPKASSKVPFFSASIISSIVIRRSVKSNPKSLSNVITLFRVIPSKTEPSSFGVINLPSILKKMFIVPTS